MKRSSERSAATPRLEFHAAARGVFIIISLIGIAACSSTPKPAPAAGNLNNQSTFAGKPIDPQLYALLDSLRLAVEMRDETRFQALLTQARAKKPPSEVSAFLDQLSSIVNGRAIARALERGARVEALRDQVTMGDPISLQLVLTNSAIGDKSASIEIPRKTGGGLFSAGPAVRSQLLASVTTTDLDAYGGESSITNTLPVAMREDIKIGPGETYKMEFQMDGTAPRAAVARIVEIAIELIPSETRFDGQAVVITRIPFAPARVVALPPGFEAFAADPAAALERALARLENAYDRDILPCALMVPAESREKAILSLARRLTNAATGRQHAIIGALRQVTGERDRGVDRDAWIGWATVYLQKNEEPRAVSR